MHSIVPGPSFFPSRVHKLAQEVVGVGAHRQSQDHTTTLNLAKWAVTHFTLGVNDPGMSGEGMTFQIC
eukprot:3188614-Amphidinium_carterae.1